MNILGLKIKIVTEEGNFGFEETFSKQLTIIRAQNSGGKSTLFNAILYALGCEEILGGKGESFLTYCLTSNLKYNDKSIQVLSSEVYLEVENFLGEIKTFRRAIKDQYKSTKLIEIYDSSYITNKENLGPSISTYVHDGGAATNIAGFHHFLENYLGLDLPYVTNTSGGLTKLYIQTIFAAHAVEQKRGWTDYISNIPFYGIRDVKTRVIEYILGLEVFKTNELRNNYLSIINRINNDWELYFNKLTQKIQEQNGLLVGLHPKPTLLFSEQDCMVLLSDNITIEDRISNLNKEYLEAQQKENTENNIPGEIILNNIEEITDELKLLMIKFDRINDLISRNKISISDYSEIIQQVNQDLNKNKSALKLRNLGANFNIKVSKNTCPTCFQNIVDNLLAEDIKGPQMDLEEQIEYLKSQKKMLENQIEGLNLENSNLTMKLNNTKKEIDRKNEVIRSLKKSITSGTELSKLYLRQQIYIENEIHQLQELKKLIQETKIKFNELIAEYKKVKSDLDKLPKDLYNLSDRKKISSFEKHFQNNAKKFQYNSAPISDITINMDNLLPSLNHIELREIRKSNIKVDSSASDFVRLIWSFLLGLQQIGHDYACNNLNLILLDEPGQHSMALSSQRALFAELASISNLQSIVAASFDNSEENFQEITNGLKFKLISWDGKLIKPFRE